MLTELFRQPRLPNASARLQAPTHTDAAVFVDFKQLRHTSKGVSKSQVEGKAACARKPAGAGRIPALWRCVLLMSWQCMMSTPSLPNTWTASHCEKMNVSSGAQPSWQGHPWKTPLRLPAKLQCSPLVKTPG